MIIIVHSEMSASKVATSLGVPEYSYHFVLKSYWPVLEKFGIVVTASDPEHEVDAIRRGACRHGQDSIFLSFSPPHKTVTNLQCPTIPVFAWEFDTIPNEVWDNEPRNDWTAVLRKLGRAITHSNFIVKVVKEAVGADYPIISVPAPVWDQFNSLYRPGIWNREPIEICVNGPVIDSRKDDLSSFPECLSIVAEADGNPKAFQTTNLRLDGIVYCSLFNPHDPRKNWLSMLCAFCLTFRDMPDATLVWKLSHHDAYHPMRHMVFELSRLMPFKCRVVIIDSFISNEDYEKLIRGAAYVVNASAGEGQCLPLMELMSAGKPAVAPNNSSMADYITSENAFIVGSSLEPCAWPHDRRFAYRARQHRVDVSSLREAYRDSYMVAKHDPERYARMADQANRTLRAHCSRAVAEARLGAFLNVAKTPAMVEAS